MATVTVQFEDGSALLWYVDTDSNALIANDLIVDEFGEPTSYRDEDNGTAADKWLDYQTRAQ